MTATSQPRRLASEGSGELIQPPPPAALPAVTPAATEFVEGFVREHKVAIFSLEYCEFCWTIFRFFDAIGVPYSKVNIDAFEYAEGNMGNAYRAALQERTDCKTFPQFFIDGEYHGGAADACVKWRKGELQPLLEAAGRRSVSIVRRRVLSSC